MECLSCKKQIPTLEDVCSFCQTHPLRIYQCQHPSCLHIQTLSDRCIQCDRILAGPLTNKHLESGESLYHVRELIGGGGMGEVYRSIEENHAGGYLREVAIKLNKDITTPERQDRFRREVQTLIKLNHPHNTRVYGYGEQRDHQVLIAQFMAMEFLHGITLDQKIDRQPIPLPDALIIYRQIARALCEAHQKGVIHRDLKPSNIKLINLPDDPPFAKLYDFGLSKDLQDQDKPALSNSGMIMGTLWYMSPEQSRGDAVDLRSDIFSMGVILFQMLTQQLPFPANNLYQLYQLHPSGCPTLPDDLPPSIREILIRSLAYDPQDRFSSLHECLALLPSIDPDRITGWLASGEFGVPALSSPHGSLSPSFSALMPPTTPPPFTANVTGNQNSSLPSSLQEETPQLPPLWFSTNIFWGLGLLVILSSGIATFFLWRAKVTSHKPVDPRGATENPPQHRSIPSTIRTPARLAPQQTMPSTPQHTPPNPLRHNSISSQRPGPVRLTVRQKAIPPRKRTVIRKVIRKKILVALHLHPFCEKLYLVQKGQNILVASSTKQNAKSSHPSRWSQHLLPGTYTMLCLSPSIQLRRFFSFRVRPRPTQQIIKQTWQSITIKILFPRWGFPSIDGFPLSTDKKPCQVGCFARLWTGENSLVLRRPIEGTSRQAIVHKQILFLSPQLADQPITARTFTIRWGSPETPSAPPSLQRTSSSSANAPGN